MGLDFRKRSGRIANGSRLIVEGQQTIGQKVFSPTFRYKVSAPKDDDLLEQHQLNNIPQPTPTPNQTAP
jgi:hypothetical protein